jgi:hypothetical protein
MLDCFGNVSRLFGVEASRLTFTNCAEATVARADVAGEHERRSSI